MGGNQVAMASRDPSPQATAESTDLWRRWRWKRDGGAFEKLVRREVPYAVDLARRLGTDHGEAEDLVQDSLVKLARERSNAPVIVGLRAWICRRVVLGYRMRVRASSRRRRHERTAMSPESGAASSRQAARPEAALEQRDEVQAALRHLDEEQRRAVVLRYLHDLDYREIAYVLGVTENACRLRVHKALKHLRTLLGNKTPALLAAIALPAAAAHASAVKGAVAAAAVAGKKTAGGFAAVASVTAAAGTTAVLVLLPEKSEPPPPPPPAKVAAVEPAPKPAPAPAPAPAPPKAEPAPPPPPTGLDYLARHLAGDESVAARRARFETFADCIAVPAAKQPLDPVAAGERAEEAGDGLHRVRFGPGTHDLARWRVPRAERIEIIGAGREKTVLRGRDLIAVAERKSVTHLRIADCTVEGMLLDVRGGAAVLIERVTVRGWVAAGGYGAAIGNYGKLYLAARDCVFVGGYRRPAGGHALNLRGPALALFEDCRFIDLGGAIMGSKGAGRRASVLLRRPVFENSTAKPPRRDHLPEVLLRGARHVTARTARLGELLTFLDRYVEPAGSRITGVYRMQWDGADEPVWAVHLIAEGKRWIEWSPPRRGEAPVLAPRLPGRDKLYTLVPLRDAIIRAALVQPLDRQLEVHGVADWALHVGDGKLAPSVAFFDRFQDSVFQIKTETGEIQNLRRR